MPEKIGEVYSSWRNIAREALQQCDAVLDKWIVLNICSEERRKQKCCYGARNGKAQKAHVVETAFKNMATKWAKKHK